jgi:hypothetical protein
MARYPMARWRPLPENSTQPRIRPTQIILHSAVSDGRSLYPYFGLPSVKVESHFYVQEDGGVEQYLDTLVRADANYQANPRAISIETWDGGNPDRTPWNSAQLATLADLVRWCASVHDIPLRRCPSWTSSGVGYHSLFPQWSPVKKTCPGLARRPQVDGVIRAASSSPVTPTPTPPEEDIVASLDDLAKALAAQEKRIFAEIERVRVKQYTDLKNYMTNWVGLYGKNIPVPAEIGVKDPKISGLTAFSWLIAWAFRTKADTVALNAKVDALAEGLHLSPEQMQALADAAASAGAAEMAKLTADAVIVQGDVTVTPSAKPEA